MSGSLRIGPLGVEVELVFGDSLDEAARDAIRAAWCDVPSTGAEPVSRRLLHIGSAAEADEIVARIGDDGASGVEGAESSASESASAAAAGTVGTDAPTPALRPLVAGSFDALAEHLTSHVTLDAIDAHAGAAMMLHAAGIALPDGRVVAFVGPSGRGKTTLSRLLGSRHGYVTDETVHIGIRDDDFARVEPYRKPLSIKRAGLPKQQVSPAALDLLELPEAPLRLAAVVLLEREADAASASAPSASPAEYDEPVGESDGGVSAMPDSGSAPAAPVDDALAAPPVGMATTATRPATVEPVGVLDAFVELLPQLSYLASIESPLESLARLIAHVGRVQRVRYVEAESVDAVIDQLVADAPATAAGGARATTPSAVGLPADWRLGTTGEASFLTLTDDETYAPASGVHWLAVGAEDETDAIIMRGSQLQRLAGVAPLLWVRLAAAGTMRLDDLVAVLVDVFGAPDGVDAREAVRAVLATLAESGLVVRGSGSADDDADAGRASIAAPDSAPGAAQASASSTAVESGTERA